LNRHGGWIFTSWAKLKEHRTAGNRPKNLTMRNIYIPLHLSDKAIHQEMQHDIIDDDPVPIGEPVKRALRLARGELEHPEHLLIPEEWIVSLNIHVELSLKYIHTEHGGS
jgi:hypothetical protein